MENKYNLPSGNELHIRRYIHFVETRPKRIYKSKVGLYRHHILPVAFGASRNYKDEPNNIIVLTAREHFIAHIILWKAYGGKMADALRLMTQRNLERKLTSRQYETLVHSAPWNKGMKGKKSWNKGIPLTKEHKKKLSENHRDMHGENNHNYGKKGKLSPLYGKTRHQEAMEGVRRYAEEHGPAMLGYHFSEEQKELKRKKVWTEEEKERLKLGQQARRERELLTGTRPVLTEEQKEHLRQINLGKKHTTGWKLTEEQKEHLRQINLGKKLSEEHKANISKGLNKHYTTS